LFHIALKPVNGTGLAKRDRLETTPKMILARRERTEKVLAKRKSVIPSWKPQKSPTAPNQHVKSALLLMHLCAEGIPNDMTISPELFS
jgi:hypothetical protein